MQPLVDVINGFLPQVNDAQLGMIKIFGALVALALLGLLFSRIGGK